MQASFLTRGPSPVLPAGACLIAHYNGIDIWRTATSFFLCEGDSVVQLDPVASTGRGVLRPSLWSNPNRVSLELINLVIQSLLLLLHHRSHYPLHGAALAREQDGLLLVAASNSGKSTLALTLVRRGWHYLSDDSLILRPAADAVEARPLRRDFGLDQDAVHFFPEIAAHRRPYFSDERKQRINMAALYPGQAIDCCIPRVLLFPQIISRAKSSLTPINKAEALFRLMQQSFFLALDPSMAAAHLDVLNRLVQQTEHYQLLAGQDMRDDPALLEHMLAHILPGQAAVPSEMLAEDG